MISNGCWAGRRIRRCRRNARAAAILAALLLPAWLPVTAAPAIANTDVSAPTERFTIDEIRVEGLRRVEIGAVLGNLPFRKGDPYSAEKGIAAIRALFGAGLFDDVRLQALAGGVLVIHVRERAVIAGIEFSGIEKFDKKTLEGALKDIGLAEGRAYDRALLARAEREMKRQYLNAGMYGARVLVTATPVESERVFISIAVQESEVARIAAVQISGNQAFSSDELLAQIDLSASSAMSWYTKSDQYSREKLSAGLDALRSFYLNRGYAEFEITSTLVSITPEKDRIAIAIQIHEGPLYTVSSTELRGEYLGRDEEFRRLVQIKAGGAYNASLITRTVSALRERFGDYGYAFARVETQTNLDKEKLLAHIVLTAQPSKRVYVRRVRINGNTYTQDDVARRELRQYENSWYNGAKIRLSRDRIDRTGLFKEVSITEEPVTGSDDLVDLDVTLAERPTGSLMVGASYSTSVGLGFNGAITQENVMGRGNSLTLRVDSNEYYQTASVTSLERYWLPSGISRTLTASYSRATPLASEGGNYVILTPGAAINFGVPISEADTVYLGALVDLPDITSGTNMPDAYAAYVARYGRYSTIFALTAGWGRDSRDSALAPSSGRKQGVAGEWGVLADARYARVSYSVQQFWPVGERYAFSLSSVLGYGEGLEGEPYPVLKNFRAGGIGSVRNFQQSSLGPIDSIGVRTGGTQLVTGSAEWLMPFPGAPKDRTLRLFLYYDIGNVFGESESVKFSALRSSAGIGLNWYSPVGPLRFIYGAPLKSESTDKIESFQLQIGVMF